MSTSALSETDLASIGTSDIPCQFNHDHQAVPKSCRECTVEVTNLATTSCGREDMFLCDAGAAAMTMFITAGKVVTCHVCKEPPSTHWNVRPI